MTIIIGIIIGADHTGVMATTWWQWPHMVVWPCVATMQTTFCIFRPTNWGRWRLCYWWRLWWQKPTERALCLALSYETISDSVISSVYVSYLCLRCLNCLHCLHVGNLRCPWFVVLNLVCAGANSRLATLWGQWTEPDADFDDEDGDEYHMK